MAQINQKLKVISDALDTLQKSINLYKEYKAIFNEFPNNKNEQFFMAMRDSMIQRFEYCVDLFWKVLRFYLEEIEKVTLPSYSPRGVIRETVKIKTLSEAEGDECIKMVLNRNQTSHIYHEETAHAIAENIPEFYLLMRNLVDRIQNKVTLTKNPE
jgi:nucleotidyltransferase substrate binding protein (TIGR01987 family)